MNTMSPKVESERIEVTTWAAIPSAQAAAGEAATRPARRFVPARWLVDLLALGLAGMLAGAAALYGLAVVAAGTPRPSAPMADRVTRDAPDGGASELRVGSDILCCRETQ